MKDEKQILNNLDGILLCLRAAGWEPETVVIQMGIDSLTVEDLTKIREMLQDGHNE